MFSINLQINQSESLDYCYLLDDNSYEYFDVTYLECCNNEQEKCNFPSTVHAPKNCEWTPLAYIRPQFVPAEYKTITVETRLDSGINTIDGEVFLHATFDSDIEVAEINGMPVVGQVATTENPSSATNITIRLRSKVGKFVRGVISYTSQTECIQNQNATFSYDSNKIPLFENTVNVTLYTDTYYTLPLSFESFKNNNWNYMYPVYPRDPNDPNIYFYLPVDDPGGDPIINNFVTIPKPYDQWNSPIITPIQSTLIVYQSFIVYNQHLQLSFWYRQIETRETYLNTDIGWTLNYYNRTYNPKTNYDGFTSPITQISAQFANETTVFVALLYSTLSGTVVLTVELWDIDDMSNPIHTKNFTTDIPPSTSLFIQTFTCGTIAYFVITNLLVSSNLDQWNIPTAYTGFLDYGVACHGDDDVIYVDATNNVFSINTPDSIATLTPPTGFSNLYDFQATKDFLCAIWVVNTAAGYNWTVIAVHTLFTNSTFTKGSIVKQYMPNMYFMGDEEAQETIVVKDSTFYVTLENSSPTSGSFEEPLIFVIKMPESKEITSDLPFTAYTGNASDLSTPTLTLISSDDSDIQITITYNNDGNLTLTQPDGTVQYQPVIESDTPFDIVRASDGTFTFNSSDAGRFSLIIGAPPASITVSSSPAPPLHTVSIGPRSIVDWNKAQENEIACLPTNENDQECTFDHTFAELDATKGWNISLTLQRRLCSARYSMHLVNSVPENFVIQTNVWSYTMQVGECIDIIAGSARISTETFTPTPNPGNWTPGGNFSSLCITNSSTLQTIYTCGNGDLREYIIKSDCALYWNFSGLQSVNHDSTQCIWYGIGDFTGILLSPGSPGNVNVDPTSTEIYYRSGSTGPFLGVGTQLAKVPAKYENLLKSTGETFPWTVGKEDGFIVSDANISSIEVNGTTFNCPTSNSKTTLFLYSDLGNVAPPSTIIQLNLGPTDELQSLMVRPWFQWEGVEASGLPVNCAYKV